MNERFGRRILVCDYVHQLLIDGLSAQGYHVVYAPEITLPYVQQCLPECTGVIVNTRTPIDGALMRQCPDLQFIGRLGVGLDIFDIAAAEELGIRLMNTPGANANAVGEHMFGMLLSLMHNIARADRSVRGGAWVRESFRGRELRGLKVGVIGVGNTGTAFASKFDNWETEILAYDKYKSHYSDEIRFLRAVSLEELLEQSDIISLHVPLTQETYHLVDRAFLRRCKDGVVILNGSRGKVIDSSALIEALESRKVSGACLDVLENEKLQTLSDLEQQQFDTLVRRDNVVLTPHIAGWSHSSKRNIAEQMLDRVSEL